MPVRYSGLIVLLATLAWSGCVQLPPAAPAPPAPAPPPSGSRSAAIVDGVLREANRARRAEGVRELQRAAPLDQAAAGHAAELARRGVLVHTSTVPGRRTITERIEAVGVQWRAAAENLASIPEQMEDVPAQTIRLWLNSPGHRRNLLDRTYNYTGVGIAYANGYWYIVQLYVLPRSD